MNNESPFNSSLEIPQIVTPDTSQQSKRSRAGTLPTQLAFTTLSDQSLTIGQNTGSRRTRSSSFQNSIWSDSPAIPANPKSPILFPEINGTSQNLPQINLGYPEFLPSRSRSLSVNNNADPFVSSLPLPSIHHYPQGRQRASTVNTPMQSGPLLHDNAAEQFVCDIQQPSCTLLFSRLIRGSINAAALYSVVSAFGICSCVRTMTRSNGEFIGIVEFEMLESSIACKAALNRREIFPQVFALVEFAQIGNSRKDNLFSYCLNKDETCHLNHILTASVWYSAEAKSDFGPLPEPLPARMFDSPKLREIRKNIDNANFTPQYIDELSLAMVPELPELASDYLGNTIVQKLFELSSPIGRDIMLREVAPYLSQMGTHKNGTWAAQKIINTCHSKREMSTIVKSLKPYASMLFNDQFGNYVLQGVLRFESPYSDFIFEAIVCKFDEISHGRFGARAIRTCLESEHISKSQMVAVASCIVVAFENLAVDNNGSLLITWFLDTCTLPNRHSILTPIILKNLVPLCTHKLASLTVLRLLHHRADLNPRNAILKQIFGDFSNPERFYLPPCKTLKDILVDKVNGVNFIYKCLTIPMLEPVVKNHMAHQIKSCILDLNLASNPSYRRLVEEVGLRFDSIPAPSGPSTRQFPLYPPTFPNNAPFMAQQPLPYTIDQNLINQMDQLTMNHVSTQPPRNGHYHGGNVLHK